MHINRSPASSPMYRRLWRWHFYAGLICLPFVFLLATTGAIYLFRSEIEDIVYRDLLFVQMQTSALNAEAIIDSAHKTLPGRVLRYIPATTAERSAQVDVQASDNTTMQVFVNPGTGQVLGTIAESMRLMPLVRSLHSLTLFGTAANYWTEVVAGWVIVLVTTGIYLWWPRGRSGGVFSVRQTPTARLWWRDVHAVSGAIAGVIVLFLALTGMPWTAFWGTQFNRLITAYGLGVPSQASTAVPQSKHHTSSNDSNELPWSLRESSVPQSSENKTVHPPASVNQIVNELEQLGLRTGYTLSIPDRSDGVYTADSLPDMVAGQRVIHLDQYTGKPLADIQYANYGVVSKITEWGISVHKGREYGRSNQLLMLVGAVALIVLSITAITMWWKRRPSGLLAAPPRQDADRMTRSVVAIAVILGLFFPLLGTSMLVILIIDWIVPIVWRSRWGL